MELMKSKIGLSLSGGGIRAAIFHLGVLQYLAEAGLLGHITSISSVSGASLCVGAIFATNNNKWPTGKEYLNSVQPKVREIILNNNIQKSALRRLPISPWYWRNKSGLIAKMLEDKWGINGTLQDLPTFPYWEINCTTFETGKRFRFRRDYMGDHSVGYVQNPALPISHVIAASAGFPVLIGPYVLKTDGMQWTKDKHGRGEAALVDDHYTLWDGGVYDNLGLEALYKIGRGLDEEINFIIVSNASASISFRRREGDVSLSNIIRLLDIAMSQVDSLRSREIVASIISKNKGMYIKIGNPAVESSLSPEDMYRVRNYATTLNTPSLRSYELIHQHGYENAKCVHLGRKCNISVHNNHISM